MRPNYCEFNRARRRLERSIIRYNRTPVFVEQIVYSPDPVQEAEENPIVGKIYKGLLYINPLAEMDPDCLSGEEITFLSKKFDIEGQSQDQLRHMVALVNSTIRREFARRKNVPEGIVPANHIHLNLRELDNKTTRIVPQTDPLLDVSTVPLGMMNIGNSCGFVTRSPSRRQYTQGVSLDSFSTKWIGDNPIRNDKKTWEKSLKETILGVYPNFHQIMNEFAGNEKVLSRAFSRDLAIEIDRNLGLCYLCYKADTVAWSDTGDTWTLSESFRFLKETLVEKGVKLNDLS